ncbi:MAG: cbb3-type cytochrome c oxidase subunit 3 [Ignavibacteriaceae bacterium]|nr:cbb3-type cytochrome c oxidase subunit 3 [Ignavibacteriaceae bacterium]
MFKEVLQSIEGIEIYTIISMIIFILFFIGMSIWLFKVDKKYIKTMSELPLKEDNNQVSNFTGGTNEAF